MSNPEILQPEKKTTVETPKEQKIPPTIEAERRSGDLLTNTETKPVAPESESVLEKIIVGSVISNKDGKYKIKVLETPEESNNYKFKLTYLSEPGSESKISMEELAKIMRDEDLVVIPEETPPLAPSESEVVVPPIDTPPEQTEVPTSAPEEETVPKNLKEKAVVGEIENFSEKDKEQLGWGLKTIGFRVEKMKNDFFAGTFNLLLKDDKKTETKGLDKKSTVGRFFTELRDSFIRDSKEAEQKGMDIKEGKDKGKISKIKNIGLLAGNVLKYGRIVADVTGASIANPFRYVMMGGMVTTRAAEAGKETRFKNEELLEKTRIQDADKAAEEAWKIYEQAGGIFGEDGEAKGASVEDLKKAYLAQMPKDILERLKDPAVSLSFVQKMLRSKISGDMLTLSSKLSWVGYSKSKKDPEGNNEKILSDKDIEFEKQKLLKKYEKDLKDYDRMITQYGTVDQIAESARLAQKVGKLVVLAMQIETAVVSLEHLFTGLSHILSNHHDIDTNHTADSNSHPAETQTAPASPNSLPTTPDATVPNLHEHIEINPNAVPVTNFHGVSITFEHGHGGIKGIEDLQNQLSKQYPDITKAPQNVQDFMHANPTQEAMKLGLYNPNSPDESALIKTGSILKLDEHGNLSIHEAITGKEDILIHGDTSYVEQYHETMFHSGHHDVLHTPTPENTTPESAINAENYHGQALNVHTGQPVTTHLGSTGHQLDSHIEIGGREYNIINENGHQVYVGIETQHGILIKIFPENHNLVKYYDEKTGKLLELQSTPKTSLNGTLEQVNQILLSRHADDWAKIHHWSVEKIGKTTEYTNDPNHNQIWRYIRELEDKGFKPKGKHWFSRPETVEKYLKRVIQEAKVKNITLPKPE